MEVFYRHASPNIRPTGWQRTVLELHKATDRSQRPLNADDVGGTTHRVPTLVKSNLKTMIVTLWIPPAIQQFATENCQGIEKIPIQIGHCPSLY